MNLYLNLGCFMVSKYKVVLGRIFQSLLFIGICGLFLGSKQVEETGKLALSQEIPQRAFVTTEASKEIIPINLKSGVAEEAMNLDFHARILAFSPDRQFGYLANRDTAELVKMDMATGKTTKVAAPPGEPHRLALSSDGQKGYAAYVNSHEIVSFDFASETFSTLISLDAIPNSLVINGNDERLFVSFRDRRDIAAVDLNSMSVSTFLMLVRPVEDLEISFDNNTLYAAEQGRSSLVIIDIPSKKYRTIACEGAKLTDVMLGKGRSGSLYMANLNGREIFHLNLKTLVFNPVVKLSQLIDSIAFLPDPELVASFTVKEQGAIVLFDASATQAKRSGKIDYEWDFGDGLTGYYR